MRSPREGETRGPSFQRLAERKTSRCTELAAPWAQQGLRGRVTRGFSWKDTEPRPFSLHLVGVGRRGAAHGSHSKGRLTHVNVHGMWAQQSGLSQDWHAAGRGEPRKESGRGRNQDRDPRLSTKTPQMLVNKKPFLGNGKSMARGGGGNCEPSMSTALTPSMRAPKRGGANGVSCEMDQQGLPMGW